MKKLLLATVLVAAGTSAFAADAGNYVFGNVGVSSNQWTLKDNAVSRSGVASSKVNKDDATSGIAEIGIGQRVNDHFAVEASYLNSGDATRLKGAGSLDYDTFRVAALGIIPVNEKVEVYGKVSGNYIRSKFTSESAALNSSKDNSFGVGLGVGAAYNINKQLSARVEYDTLGNIGHKDITDTAAVNTVKIGLGYRF